MEIIPSLSQMSEKAMLARMDLKDFNKYRVVERRKVDTANL
jgi:hypothetical protein